MILALETSCDDTCAAVVSHAGEVLSSIVSSQGVHDRFGGVVPEIASRHHLELVNAVVDDALRQAGATLDDVSLVAVTQGPGLVGALLVGVATAKGLAAARRLPLAPVDHLQGHVAANFLAPDPIEPPFICLIASGGHTLLVRVTDHARLRGDRADARRRRRRGVRQGRAAARARLPGRAGAVAAGARGRSARVRLPDRRARRRASTSRSRASRPRCCTRSATWGRRRRARRAADLAASYEHAIVEALVARIERALAAEPGARLAIGGGVAANRRLRERAGSLGVEVKVPPPELCTDNAAMIASAARWVEPLPYPRYLDLDAYATGRRSRAA